MKLITCLIVFCLILIVLSSGPIVTPASQLPKCPIVLEQFQNSTAPMPSRGRWVAWAEWLCLPLRRRSRRRRLTRWLRRLQRWWRRYTQRVKRWVHLRRERQACMEEASPPGPIAQDQLSSTSSQTESAPQVESIPGSEAGATPTVPPTETPTAQPTQRGPGRPREIPTDHVCCPHEDCSSCGVFGPHPEHDIVGNGTYTTVHGEKRQMYQCNVCEQPFSETACLRAPHRQAGTPFFGLKTPMKTVCIALNELAEGLGVRAVARIHGVEPDTVLGWLHKACLRAPHRQAGQHCEAVSAHMMRELDLS